MRESCPWCGRDFALRTSGGRVQKFCSTRCRRALDAAGRRYIRDALTSGALTIADLRNGSVTTRALSVGARDGGGENAPVPPILRA